MKRAVCLILGVFLAVGAALSRQPAENYARLMKEADSCFRNNDMDKALACYGKVMECRPAVSGNDSEMEDYRAAIVIALKRIGTIHMNIGNYYTAYKNLLDALSACEKYGLESELPPLYNNIGNIYYHFKKYDVAGNYYRKALELSPDSVSAGYYNNLGLALAECGRNDSALHCFNKSLEICRRYNNDRLFALYNSMASLYKKSRKYNEALRYYRLSWQESRKNRRVEHEAQNLSDLGKLFLCMGNVDSARYYIDRSDQLASHNRFLKVMAENSLVLSDIEARMGDTERAFGYYKKYAGLRDSLFNNNIFGDISRLQRSYETEKTDRKIEHLEEERQRKERAVWITVCVLVIVCLISGYIYLQNKKLNKAYKALVEKNLEIKNFREQDKIKDTSQAAAGSDDLFDKILAVMEDTALICSPEFSVGKLAVAVGSNATYVSRAIKNATDKSFRSFLNGYRVREAQRIFSDSDSVRYTVESVALRVGFKSRNTFHDVFKEITGVAPGFYMKSLHERSKTL